MKLDRRSFLSFIIGGAAGTALSPLPYKLTDDLAIWSQNWPWTPVPPDGAVSYVNSTCMLCPGGCGISVRKVDERAVKIEGLKGHPLNDGGICLLGLSGLQLLYGPGRVRQPLQRVGPRGAGGWRAISWKEAISQAAAKLAELRAGNKPQMLGCIVDSGRGTVPSLLERFLTVYGSPNFFPTASIWDSYEYTLHVMQGLQATVGFDLAESDFVLSFGSGLAQGWGAPVRMFLALSGLRQKDARIVQVEPRLSNTAAKADWIAIKPGTEAALALGLAHVIIRGSLYDKAFVENAAFGFSDWTDAAGNSRKGFKQFVLENYSPEKTAQITGIDKSVVESLGQAFARAGRPVAVCGRGRGTTPGSIGEFMAVHALNALVGNINKPGGVWSLPEPDDFNWPEPEMDAIASAGAQQMRLDEAGSQRYPFTRSSLERVPAAISEGRGELQVLMVAEANPLYGLKDTAAVKEAFAKIPFVISFSSFMDETALNADLILPNHVYLERFEDVPTPPGVNRPTIGLARPVTAPLYDTRNTGDVILQLAAALGGNIGRAFPWKNYKACLQESLGDKWPALEEDGYWCRTDFRPAAGRDAFETPSGKFEFFATALDSELKKGEAAFPHFEQVEPEGDPQSYPLILIPYDDIRLGPGSLGAPPFLIKTVSDKELKGTEILVEVNPATAESLGLSEGRRAVLATPRGRAKVKVHLFDGIMPGFVAMARGLGHSVPDKYLGGKGANFNGLIAPVADPISGLDAAWGIRAALSKA